MIRSMTGFGDASGKTDDAEFFVELRSVNNKYFKAVFRLPDEFQSLEPILETAMRRTLKRGTVTLRVAVSETSERAALDINSSALQRYIEQLEGTEAIQSGRVKLDAGSLVTLPGVLQPPGGEDERLRQTRAVLEPLVEKAAEKLLDMRQVEGAAARDDLMSQHDVIASRLAEIEERAPEVVKVYQERLQGRMQALLADAEMTVQPAELIREIAVYAEKTDIAEEIVRLRGHLVQFKERLNDDAGEPVGRTLDFITQEMLREANTIASKSPDAEVSKRTVEIKGAIDRIKEQVQNIE
ncbi:MAG: YicC/YloC family endoribonuclease [Planctomycetota bacterium]